MIRAQWVGGPRDGEWVILEHALVRIPVGRNGAVEGYVDVPPISTALGWRLYWPRGVC